MTETIKNILRLLTLFGVVTMMGGFESQLDSKKEKKIKVVECNKTPNVKGCPDLSRYSSRGYSP